MTTTFTATAYQNEFLPLGGQRVDAIVTVSASGANLDRAPADSAVMLLLDTSGSMHPRPKWRALQRAAEAAIAQIPDGVLFGVISGSDIAEVVYPRSHGLVRATRDTRSEAIACVGMMRAGGGTAIGQWLLAAGDRLSQYENAIRQGILITDGRDESETRQDLYAAVCASQGLFQCDCRGVGTDWAVDELRWIASSLLGSVDIVADPDDMPADFESMMLHAMGRRSADVRMRVWVPKGAKVDFFKQVSPSIEDLTSRASVVEERTVEYPTGAWGAESRDYHVSISVVPQPVGAEMLAARVTLVVDASPAAQSLLKAVWTDDMAASTRINPRVAHFTDQVELADAIAEGLEARARGDMSRATHCLGRAARLANGVGNDDTLRLLARVVDIVDATTGTVRIRRDVRLVDAMTLDTRSTRTIRVGSD